MATAAWLRCGVLFLLLQFAPISAVLGATPAEPSGAHPRLFLEGQTAANLQKQARKNGTAISAAVARCRQIEAAPAQFARDGYMGLDWAQYLQACLIAWKATGDMGALRTAVRYFRALLNDRHVVGDAKGGDDVASRNSGYAMRAHGPYAALAYDWLHDAPGVDASLLALARRRFKAWTDWYAADGYRARSPGTNYNAGYVFAATLIAIAQGGEAGKDGEKLWRHVVETLFAQDLMPSMVNGVLRGGDWGEGWQYGPLSVVEYALAARAAARYGVDISPVAPWLRQVVMRHVHGLTPPGDRTYAGGDADLESPNLPVRPYTLVAVVAGPAAAESKQWAMAELQRLRLSGTQADFPLFSALAEAERVAPAEFPREVSQLTYFAKGTSTFHARSSWSPRAIWFVTPCSGVIDVDHVHRNAGSFVLSRGADDLIVDPSPYGTLSSLTGNAPTVVSGNLPPEYRPSQAYWGQKTGFRWITTASSGIVAVRCDYADQYRIQQTPSDIPVAYRDLVLIPYSEQSGAESALLIVLDRSSGETPAQALHLRFRSLADLSPDKAGASGRIGDSRVHIRRLQASAIEAKLRKLRRGSCFTEEYTRGNCDAARFPVSEISAVLAGPDAFALHLIEATPSKLPLSDAIELHASGGTAWSVERGRATWVVAVPSSPAAMSYRVPASPARHVMLPFPVAGRDRIRVYSTQDAVTCRVIIGGDKGAEIPGRPGMFELDSACQPTAVN